MNKEERKFYASLIEPIMNWSYNPITEKGKVFINGIEITDSESWNKVLESLSILKKENTDLKQINQKLKEQSELEFNDFIKLKRDQEDRHLEKTSKLIKEKQHLKQALNKIEELLTEPTLEAIWKIPKCIKIIDKVLDLDKVRNEK